MAELEVVSVAEQWATCRTISATRPVDVGDAWSVSGRWRPRRRRPRRPSAPPPCQPRRRSPPASAEAPAPPAPPPRARGAGEPASFTVKYRSAANVYLDAGRARGPRRGRPAPRGRGPDDRRRAGGRLRRRAVGLVQGALGDAPGPRRATWRSCWSAPRPAPGRGRHDRGDGTPARPPPRDEPRRRSSAPLRGPAPRAPWARVRGGASVRLLPQLGPDGVRTRLPASSTARRRPGALRHRRPAAELHPARPQPAGRAARCASATGRRRASAPTGSTRWPCATSRRPTASASSSGASGSTASSWASATSTGASCASGPADSVQVGAFAGRVADVDGLGLEGTGQKYGGFVRLAPGGRYATSGLRRRRSPSCARTPTGT